MGTVYRRTARGNYYGEYTDSAGRRVRRSTGTTNKQDAQRIVARWESDENSLRHGLTVDRGTTLEQLLREYLDYIGGGSQQHVAKTEARIRRVIEANDWTQHRQVNQLQVETTIRGFLDEKSGNKIALRTQGHYIGAVKSFTRWLTDVRKVYARNPLASVKKPNFEHDRKLIRRFLLPAEWPWLAQTKHAILYQTAIETGYRANELRLIRREHITDNQIYLPASATKNRVAARQHITADLKAKLDSIDIPFVVADDDRLAEMLRDDLAHARERYLSSLGNAEPDPFFLQPANALGHVLDFHALRHTCGAWLAISGVNAKVIQRVMRHSTIVLTLDTYGHLMPGAEADAIVHIASIMHNGRPN